MESKADGKDGPLLFTADTGTAGSCMLLAQVSMPILLFLPRASKVTLAGGTNAIKVLPLLGLTASSYSSSFDIAGSSH
jgi:RNA 3'-terminal phosphate cyclase